MARDEHSPDAPSSAIIGANRCHDNGGSGIALHSSTSDEIAKNACWGNVGSGIVLACDDEASEAPSSGIIRGNRCHNNAEAGINLQSSVSDDIVGNACWGNGKSGIVLQRDTSSPEAPCSAIIRANRCHDNGWTGIILFSSTSDEIAENECWSNEGSGILLQRDPSSPKEPCSAIIRANCCHDNRGAGIGLASSTSDEIAENECWSNESDGIVLRRDPSSPKEPSSAKIHANRCQNNDQSGLAFFASTGKAEHNLFKNNGSNDIIFADRNGDILNPAPVIGEGNRDEPSLDLRASFYPALREAVIAAHPKLTKEEERLSDLTGFLTSGCRGCFYSFWTGHHHPKTQQENRHLDPRAWHVRPDMQSADRLAMISLSRSDLVSGVTARFLRMRAEAGPAGKGDARWAAFVSPDAEDLSQIASAITEKRRAEQGGYVAGRTIEEPVTISMEQLRDDITPLKDRISDSLMIGRNLWAERLRAAAALLRLRWIVPALLAVFAMAFFTGWPLGPAQIMSVISNFVATNLSWEGSFGNLATIFLVLLIFLGLLDTAMPPHLRFLTRRKDSNAAPGRFEQSGLASLISFERANFSLFFPDSWPDKATLRWQVRALFRRADAAFLILRDTEQWQDGDLEWLGKLSQQLPEGAQLITLIHIDGRMSLGPLLIDPVNLPWADGFELFLNDDEARLRLRPADKGEGQLVLPDDLVLLGAADERQAKQWASDFVDDQWTILDLLPTLPIASAPTARAELFSKETASADLQSDLLKRDFPAARDFFIGDSDNEITADSQLIDILFPDAGKAKALRVKISSLRGNIGALSPAGLVHGPRSGRL